MKKKHAILFGSTAMLTLALAGSVGAVAASAAEITHESEQNNTKVTISYQADEEWSVTIPDTITIGTAADVSASGVKLAQGNSLQVKVSSENYSSGWKLKSGEKSIDYKLQAGADEGALSDLENNGIVLEVKQSEGQDNGSAKIKATVDGDPVTGETPYTDELTFTVTVAEGE